jgi:AbrB family looped-hinge helix DNA binding protein
METTISSKYQMVIPKDIRERLNLKPGQRLTVIEKGGVVHLIPIKPLKSLRGMAKGIPVTGYRDKTERF